MKILQRHSSRRSTAGFSLVEVALAVAIAALGIITCLGLLPEGLEMSRRTSEMAINSNILEQIIRDMENTSWSYLNTQTGKVRRYYNDQGTQVTEQASDITYVVEIDFSIPAYLPASTAPLAEQANLKRLIIRMATATSAGYKFEGRSPALYSTFNHLVAKSQPNVTSP